MTAAAMFTPQTLDVPEHTFTIPEKDRRWKADPKTFKIREYTVAQELDAMAVAKSGTQLEYELLQRTVIELDGKPVDQGADFLGRFSNATRKRMQRALNLVNMPDPEEDEAFLLSQETAV